MRKTDIKPLGLYIHIPFCASKCAYCDFYSFVPQDEEIQRHYVSALQLQMEDFAGDCRGYAVDSVFIGGGTPTVLPPKLLHRVIDAVWRNFSLTDDVEITLEANPATVDLKGLKKLHRAGISRLSMGLQSAHARELTALGRIHTREDFERSFSDARDAGFDNINIDLMYGIPQQTAASFLKSLDTAALLGPEHLSVYGLKIEEGTPFWDARASLPLPDEDTEYEMYMRCVEHLASRGYEQYEISNFARPGYRCRHNLKYWSCGEYLGLGAAAHSDFGGERFAAVRDAQAYIDGMELVGQADSIWSERSAIGEAERKSEFVMLGMRLREGISCRDFTAHFGASLDDYCGRLLQAYVPDGFVTFDGDRYAFTPKGMYVSNYILSSVLPMDYAE